MVVVHLHLLCNAVECGVSLEFSEIDEVLAAAAQVFDVSCV
jgi:hypothetical protein